MVVNRELIDRVKVLLSNILSVPSNLLKDETTMNDISSWDSLKHLEIIIGLEEEFSIQITGQEAIRLIDIEQIMMFLDNKIN